MQRGKDKRAFTIVEVLIALTITALLFAAVAVAFNASIKNYEENEDIFKTMNKARQALLRMTTQLRTANSVNTGSPTTECTLVTAAGQNITYRYDSTARKLYLVTNAAPSSSHVLCDNVTAMNFKNNTQSVEISMTIGIGDVSQTVSSAAVIRKKLP